MAARHVSDEIGRVASYKFAEHCNRGHWQIVANTIINILVLKMAENLLTK
jgi:hypothetical protein